jgi:muramoyltetrapeptide carboxypeptidase
VTASIQRPPSLQTGDLVRVVAPSSPFSADDMHAGIAVLEAWGLRAHARDDIHDRRAYFAGTARRRAEELHEAFADPECKAILPVRGGYGLTTVLPLLDRELIRANPTAIVGCSDFTVLLNYLVQECGTAAFHGPMLGSLGRGKDPAGADRLKDLLFGGKPGTVRSGTDEAEGWCVSPGVGKGVAVGGSLSLIAAQCGTPWQLDTEGRVLFLEDVGERPYRVDRLLVQLDQAGLLDGAAAVVLGDFTGCEDGDGALTWRHAVDRIFRRKALPVLAGLPFGHGNPNLAFPVGVRCEVDAGRGSVRFRKSALA